MILTAKSIGYKALTALNSSKKIRVHSVFDHALYLQHGVGSLINVVKDENYISPASILIQDFQGGSFKSVGIEKGMKAGVDYRGLILGDGDLLVEFNKSSVWSPPMPPKLNELIGLMSMTLNLRILRDVIYTCPSKEGLVPLLQNVELYGPLRFYLNPPQTPAVSERARPHIETLMWEMFRGDSAMVVSNALPILGLGPGLTPSCDDFLAGLMLSLNLGGKVLRREGKSEVGFYKKVSGEIARAAKRKTTIYSQALLSQARSGEGTKAVIELVHSLLTKDPDYVAAVSKNLIKMGETSGADIATGIYYGIRFLLSRLENLEELYEFS